MRLVRYSAIVLSLLLFSTASATVTHSPAIKVVNTFGPDEQQEWIAVLGCELNYFNPDNVDLCYDPENNNFTSLLTAIRFAPNVMSPTDTAHTCAELEKLDLRMRQLAARIGRLKDRLAIFGATKDIRFALLGLSDMTFSPLVHNDELLEIRNYCIDGEKEKFDYKVMSQRYLKMMDSSIKSLIQAVDRVNKLADVNLPYTKLQDGSQINDAKKAEEVFKRWQDRPPILELFSPARKCVKNEDCNVFGGYCYGGRCTQGTNECTSNNDCPVFGSYCYNGQCT